MPALVTHFPTVSLRAGTPYAINRHLLNWTETLNSVDNNHHMSLYEIHLFIGQILVPKPLYISHLPTQEPWTYPQEELSHSASQACWKFLEIRDRVLGEVDAVTMETQRSTVLLQGAIWTARSSCWPLGPLLCSHQGHNSQMLPASTWARWALVPACSCWGGNSSNEQLWLEHTSSPSWTLLILHYRMKLFYSALPSPFLLTSVRPALQSESSPSLLMPPSFLLHRNFPDNLSQV